MHKADEKKKDTADSTHTQINSQQMVGAYL